MIREKHNPPRPKRGHAKWRGAELAWRMVIDLTAGIVVGLAIGWGLDGLIGTRPVLMIVFALLGFAAGVRVMLQSAERANKAAKAADGTGAGGEADASKDDNGATAPNDEGR